jgi:hypothetical protein
VLWWEADQISVATLLLTISFMYGGFSGVRWIFWIFPIVGTWGYSQVKKKYPRGFLKHLLYFYGITKMSGYPEYYDIHFNE